MIVIKTKQRENEERSILGQLTPIVNDGYSGKEIQPELEEALPIFIHNIINSYQEVDLISSDLIGSPHLTEWTAEIGDMYDSDTILASVIQAFSDLKTTGNRFHTVNGPMFNCRNDNGTTRNRRVDNMNVQMTFVPGTHPNELIEEFCVLNTTFLQGLFLAHTDIFLFNILVTKSYDENMNPTIGITYRIAFDGMRNKPTPPPTKKLKEDEDPIKKYSEVHEEPELNDPDFIEEFSKRKGVKVNSETGVLELDGKPMLKDYWLGTPSDDRPVSIETLDEEPNEALKDAAERFLMAQYHGAYEFSRPGQKRVKIPYYKKPSGWHIFWMRTLLGINYIKY